MCFVHFYVISLHTLAEQRAKQPPIQNQHSLLLDLVPAGHCMQHSEQPQRRMVGQERTQCASRMAAVILSNTIPR